MTGTRVLLLAALALSIVTSAGAFTTVDADRQANVTVVEDANAYLGIEEVETAALDSGSGTVEFPIPDGDLPECSPGDVGLCVKGQSVRLVEGIGIGQEQLWKLGSDEALDAETLAEQNSVVVSGATTTVFSVQNQFTGPVEVTDVEADSPDDLTVDISSGPGDTLDSGESTDVRATFECDTSVYDAEVTFDVAAVGNSVLVDRYDKSVRVTCIAA